MDSTRKLEGSAMTIIPPFVAFIMICISVARLYYLYGFDCPYDEIAGVLLVIGVFVYDIYNRCMHGSKYYLRDKESLNWYDDPQTLCEYSSRLVIDLTCVAIFICLFEIVQ